MKLRAPSASAPLAGLGSLFFLSLVLTAAVALAKPASLPEGVEFVTAVEGIEEYRLDNGLSLLLFPDASKQTATVNITYLVGSAHEGYGETGMAHLLEHLLFKGTPDHPDIPQELTAHGARPNGTTWFDRTNYFETFAATDENLEWALDLEADRMMNSFVSREDLDSEMTVVRNEFEMGENFPEAVLEERLYSTAFLWHNYGNTTIGARSDIENVPIERLQAFYRTWYRPDNAVLAVAGRFDEARALELVAEKFGPLTTPDVPMPAIYTEEPAQDGVRTVTLKRVGDKQVFALGYHIPSGSHEDYAPLEVLAFLLADTPSGRLHKALVETKKATEVRANADRFRFPALFYVESQLRKSGDVAGVRSEMIRIVEEFAQDPPSAEDVERARTKLLRDWELTLRDSPRAAIRLSEWAAMGDWRLMFLHRDRLEQVEPDDVVRVARAFFEPSNRTEGTYLPTEVAERTEVPGTPEVASLLEGYSGREAMAQGEAFEATPENVEARARRTRLANGLSLVTVPKETRAEAVTARFVLNLGTEKSLKNKKQVSNLTSEMLLRGTTTRSRQDIQDEIDRHKARLEVGGGESQVTATLETTRSSLPEMLRLLADVLRNPAFPQSEWEQLVEQNLQGFEEQKSSPFARASIEFWRHMVPRARDDVRYVATPDESIEELQGVERTQLASFHEKFYGAQNADFAIVGDFDLEPTEALVRELFGDWKAGERYERLRTGFEKRPPLEQAVETPDKESAVYQGGVRFAMKDSHADYPAMELANFMAGGGFLNSRLATRIRQKDGLSYGVRSSFFASEVDDNAFFTVWAIYAPQNDGKLVAAVREELEKIVKDGFTEEEVAEAKSGWLQQREVSRSQDRELAGRLTWQSYNARTMEWDAELERKVRELTPEAIHKAFRARVDPTALAFVRAGDFAKVAAPAEEPAEEHASR
jgi:zinc protease